MVSILGTKSILTPLTREVFGEEGDRVIHGSIEPFQTPGDERLVGMALRQFHQGGTFIHPTLLGPITSPNMNFRSVQVTLVDGKLRMQARGPHDEHPCENAKVVEADPVEMDQTQVDNVILLVSAIHKQNHLCVGDACKEAPDILRQIEPRTTILVAKIEREEAMALCSRCGEDEIKNSREYELHVVIDGRQIPYHSPVPIYSTSK